MNRAGQGMRQEITALASSRAGNDVKAAQHERSELGLDIRAREQFDAVGWSIDALPDDPTDLASAERLRFGNGKGSFR
jgi:hypothetical protein